MRGTGGGGLALSPESLRAWGSDVEREETMRDGRLWSRGPLGRRKRPGEEAFSSAPLWRGSFLAKTTGVGNTAPTSPVKTEKLWFTF